MSNFNFETVFIIEELPLFDPSACNPLYRHRACTTTKAKPLMSLLPALPILSPRWKSLTYTSLITCYFSFTKMNRYSLHIVLEERPVLYEQIFKLESWEHLLIILQTTNVLVSVAQSTCNCRIYNMRNVHYESIVCVHKGWHAWKIAAEKQLRNNV